MQCYTATFHAYMRIQLFYGIAIAEAFEMDSKPKDHIHRGKTLRMNRLTIAILQLKVHACMFASTIFNFQIATRYGLY